MSLHVCPSPINLYRWIINSSLYQLVQMFCSLETIAASAHWPCWRFDAVLAAGVVHGLAGFWAQSALIRLVEAVVLVVAEQLQVDARAWFASALRSSFSSFLLIGLRKSYLYPSSQLVWMNLEVSLASDWQMVAFSSLWSPQSSLPSQTQRLEMHFLLLHSKASGPASATIMTKVKIHFI